jgi:hypothetical protein
LAALLNSTSEEPLLTTVLKLPVVPVLSATAVIVYGCVPPMPADDPQIKTTLFALVKIAAGVFPPGPPVW